MKLLRIGSLGKEKPVILDKDGKYKDLSSHIEDFNLLDRIRNEGYKIVMSPYVKYFVDNHEHTEVDPIKGRRIIINADDKLAISR